MSLRIAFDCDGVVADLDSALAEIATRLFGEAPKAETEIAAPATAEPGATPEGASGGPSAEEEEVEPARFRTLARRQQHDLWETVRNTENFWESLNETEPGIVARLAQLAKERRWEVIFITQRPSSAGDITQLQTQRWLIAHGYELPNVYVINSSRGKVADALSLDIVVDDRPENCLDVKLESRARAVLVWNEDLAHLPPNARRLGIEPVAGIGACLDLLTATPNGQPGLFSRIRNFIG
ncbi:MAG TPA: hypothetical protein VF332_03495 [Vicinamibacterales bacterium]